MKHLMFIEIDLPEEVGRFEVKNYKSSGLFLITQSLKKAKSDDYDGPFREFILVNKESGNVFPMGSYNLLNENFNVEDYISDINEIRNDIRAEMMPEFNQEVEIMKLKIEHELREELSAEVHEIKGAGPSESFVLEFAKILLKK